MLSPVRGQLCLQTGTSRVWMHCALLLRARPIQALAQISQFSKWTKAICVANMKTIKANISFREPVVLGDDYPGFVLVICRGHLVLFYTTVGVRWDGAVLLKDKQLS